VTTVVMIQRFRKWTYPLIALYALVFGFIACNFFATNVVKFVDGGWITIAIGGVIVAIMAIWKQGQLMPACSASDRDLTA
jgi:K+ transporter